MNKTGDGKTQLNIRIDPESRKKLFELARLERRSMASTLIVLIESAWNRVTERDENHERRK